MSGPTKYDIAIHLVGGGGFVISLALAAWLTHCHVNKVLCYAIPLALSFTTTFLAIKLIHRGVKKYGR